MSTLPVSRGVLFATVIVQLARIGERGVYDVVPIRVDSVVGTMVLEKVWIAVNELQAQPMALSLFQISWVQTGVGYRSQDNGLVHHVIHEPDQYVVAVQIGWVGRRIQVHGVVSDVKLGCPGFSDSTVVEPSKLLPD
jgi:hypothetical protein